MAGTVAIAVALTGLPEGSVSSVSTVMASTQNKHGVTALALANGANTIVVPSWAVGCVIRPDSTNATAITLKGVAGDTGVPISETEPSEVTFATPPPASIVLFSGAAGTTVTEVEFF